LRSKSEAGDGKEVRSALTVFIAAEVESQSPHEEGVTGRQGGTDLAAPG